MTEEDDEIKFRARLLKRRIEELRRADINWKEFRESELFHALQKDNADYQRKNYWNDLK